MSGVHRAPLRVRFSRRALLGLSALALIAISMTTITSGGAVETSREEIANNRYVTDPAAAEPYGMHEARLAPFVGDSFIDRAKGAVSFQFFLGTVAPALVPTVKIGQQIRLSLELPATLGLDATSGWCNPTAGGTPRVYLSAECTTIEHSNGSTRVDVVLTAKRNLTSSHWVYLRENSIGVRGRDGQVVGAGRALITVEFPDDVGHFRRSTQELPFTTAVGVATDLDVRNAQVTVDGGTGTPSYYTHDTGYVNFETNLADPANRGVTLRTGESFTYAIRMPSMTGGTGTLVYDPTRTPDPSRPDACARALDGYDIRCDVVGTAIRLITTRTGPDIVNDRPIADRVYVPIKSTYASTSYAPIPTTVQVTLTAVAEQWGSRPNLGIAQFITHGYPRTGLTIARPALAPYVGSSFAGGGRGHLSFDFFQDRSSVPAYTLVESGDTLTVTVESGARFRASDAPSGPEQDDPSRNWCDGSAPWGPLLDGYLSVPTCSTSIDPTSGNAVTTVTTSALQTVPNERFSDGFRLRVDAGTALSAGTEELVVTLASSRFGTVTNNRQRTVRTTTIEGQSSGLGVWNAEALLPSSNAVGEQGAEGAEGADRSDVAAAPDGHVTWTAEPGADGGPSGPISVTTGDVITYRVELPVGLEYEAGGADDVCALPDRYTGFSVSCVTTDSSVEVALTRTGPDDAAYSFDASPPFSIPVRPTSPGSTVDDDVEITLTTTIVQSGSDHRRALAPVHTTSTDVVSGDASPDIQEPAS